MKNNKEEFIKRYLSFYPNIRLLAKPRNAFRVNTIKISEKQLLNRLDKRIKTEKIKFLKHGFYYDAPFSLASSPEYLLGFIYLQDAASQIPAEVLDPKPNEVILDIGSSPGGKTTHIAMLMKNKGTLVAIEKQQKRMPPLTNNLERLGIENTIVYNLDGKEIKKLNIKFDKILLDAPCMGNFCEDKLWFSKRKVSQISSRQQIQRELLRSALNVLRKNGVLVYSTCSLEPEENEINTEWLLRNFNIRLEKINKNIGVKGLTEVFGMKLNASIENTLRIYPGETQAFYIAKIRKLD